MAELKLQEKNRVEKFLDMSSGYVSNFSDRTFREFISDAVDLDIDDEKYHYASNSKANRLRQFIKVEDDHTAGKLLTELLIYHFEHLKDRRTDSWFKIENDEFDLKEELYKECQKIAERLKGNIVNDINAIKPNVEDLDFKKLSESIKDSIDKNLPEIALDRLHTFVMKYIRELCKKHNIAYLQDEALHSLFGKYVKFLISNNHIESEMSKRILRTSISNLDSFNDIRNNRSFAHDNPILNYEESILIFNNISSTIKFIEAIENRVDNNKEVHNTDWKDLEF
ncbi:hypothetical protein GQF61_17145 [Sphingobacterium sp. DK4209]|uniref:Abortive infection protein-like C-terminal domain-containing protein n=1 Tax=Sphingobacterium zhuxiongii TaxID=2662364 RepID=A0A5Q0QC91_9SPHI|nr:MULTISPECIES: abortive infection family protein [unclassified Sphingobacterium]MVZ67577.1 hypothetical protein [Sphingobacterium sp. DK4209]QGA26481.1 hypothetical protein GFH32_09145 [Sphingobacterium sp. dk4302]